MGSSPASHTTGLPKSRPRTPPLELWHIVFENLFSNMQLWVTDWRSDTPHIAFHRDFVDAPSAGTLFALLGFSQVRGCMAMCDYDHRNRIVPLDISVYDDILFPGSAAYIIQALISAASWCVFPWDPILEIEDTLRLEVVYGTRLKHITMVMPSNLGHS